MSCVVVNDGVLETDSGCVFVDIDQVVFHRFGYKIVVGKLWVFGPIFDCPVVEWMEVDGTDFRCLFDGADVVFS